MILNNGTMEFLEALFSSAPVPGGGGASAFSGAMAAALGGMVTNLTIGKKRYAQFEESLLESREALSNSLKRLTELTEEDAKGFEPLSKAYGLPKDTEEEQRHREKVMEEALFEACQAPMEIMREGRRVMERLSSLVEKGSALAISDVGVGILFAWAALEGASLNVYINTKMMKQRERAEKLEEEVEILRKEAEEIRTEVYTGVLEKIHPQK